MNCNRIKNYHIYENVPEKPNSLLIICEHFSRCKFGISFCAAKEEENKKLKSEDGIIGCCYKYILKDLIPNFGVLIKNKKRWAVQHLQYENDISNIENSIKQLSLQIVKENLK
jgi:hypothetical protein